MKHLTKHVRLSWIDERKRESGPLSSRAWVDLQIFVYGLPRAWWCRLFGHRPVIDGHGKPGETWNGQPDGQPRAARWVACGRCATRPTYQGTLDPYGYPTLGEPYTGPWTDADAFERQQETWLHGSLERRRDKPVYPDEPTNRWPRPSWDPSFQLVIGGWHKAWNAGRYQVEVKCGHGGSENAWAGNLILSRWFGFYWSTDNLGRGLMERLNGAGDRYESRVVGVEARPWRGELSWKCWQRRDHYSSSDPWWQRGSVNLPDLILGRTASSHSEVDRRTVGVVMPEGIYPAEVELEEWVRWRPRLRRLTTRRDYGTKITPVCAIPVPGKGENSYDCDDDGIYSSGGGGEVTDPASDWHVDAAMSIAASAMKSRRSYASESWVPSAGWPEGLVRA